jgi:hypothetical protein
MIKNKPGFLLFKKAGAKCLVRIRTNFYQEIFPNVTKVKTYVAVSDPVDP